MVESVHGCQGRLGQLPPLKLTSQLPDTYASKLPSVFALRLARDSANPMSKGCADEFYAFNNFYHGRVGFLTALDVPPKIRYPAECRVCRVTFQKQTGTPFQAHTQPVDAGNFHYAKRIGERDWFPTENQAVRCGTAIGYHWIVVIH